MVPQVLWAQETLTMAFDLDATGIIWLKDGQMESDFKNNKVIQAFEKDGKTVKKYAVVNGFPEIIQTAMQLGFKVVIYSAADEDRNLEALGLITLPDGRTAKDAIGVENIFSFPYLVHLNIKPSARPDIFMFRKGKEKKDLRVVTDQFKSRLKDEIDRQREQIKSTGQAVDETRLKGKVLLELILDSHNKLSDIDVSNVFLADDHVYNSYKGQEAQMIWATELRRNTSENWNTNHNRLLLVAGLISRAIEMVNSGHAINMKSALWALQWKPDPKMPGNVVHRLPELIAEGIFDSGLQLLKKQNSILQLQSPNEGSRSFKMVSCKVFYDAF